MHDVKLINPKISNSIKQEAAAALEVEQIIC